MKTRRNEAAWLTISILPLIAGCAIGPTLYQPLGMGGGYSDIITGPNTAQIQFAGNRYTHSLAVKEYALIRAAELTLAAGFDYFLVENESDYADHYRTPSSVQCNPYSYPSTYCYEIGGDVYTEPRTELSIRMFVGEPPDLTGYYDASYLLSY
ncbi:MAG: hypothetical protein ISN28_06430 [Ectothiorhodospiraceae bacterium AqS1]|nr:hypothetical protein [Ectothiorhodospiraceae bacterium AqS1]